MVATEGSIPAEAMAMATDRMVTSLGEFLDKNAESLSIDLIGKQLFVNNRLEH